MTNSFIIKSVFLISIILLGKLSFSQVACEGGPITVTEGNCVMIGDGTPGYVQITFTDITLFTQNGGNFDQAYVRATDGGYINVGSTGIVMNTSDNCGPCTGMTSQLSDPDYISDGYVQVCVTNGGAGVSSVTFTWETVDASGNNLCGTCSDGILNNQETGIDCGGPNCSPCPSCSDGILNNGETSIDCGGPNCPACHCSNGVQDADETGIDCGGADCEPCGTCFDGIQNQDETGIDCGGSTCLPCNTNSGTPDGTSGNCCDNTVDAVVYPTNCDQIGTSAYNLNSPEIQMTAAAISGACLPSGVGCGGVTSVGAWTQLELADGVDYLQLTPIPPYSVAPGNHTTYHAYFQGNDCSSLTYVDCQTAMQFSSGSYYLFESSVSGLDPNQDVWVYTWDSGNNAFNQTYQAVGAVSNPNQACPGSEALGEACNLGAQGASFNTPGSQGVACSGGSWGSNENTTFYSFTATDTDGSLLIENIICNDGSTGNAQFAVWTSCAAIGTYGAGFLGCAVGTATITLDPLVPGQTYYIAADGFAGDNCSWGFTGTGIQLPVEMWYFNGYHNGREVELDWGTMSEVNNDYFTIQRTLDGRTFEDIGKISGAGTTKERSEYSFIDTEPYMGTSYYRIKQTDYDGRFKYSEVISVHNGAEGLELVKTINMIGQEVTPTYTGMVIDVYSDGSTVKRYKK